MKTINIHIGAHKTGSTALQRFMFENRDRLYENGFYVPLSGRLGDGQPGHHRLAYAVHRKQFEKSPVSDLLDELETIASESVIVSSENFEHIPPCKIIEFSSALKKRGWSPRFIWFCRNKADYAVSLHYEMKKWRVNKTFYKMLVEINRTGKFVAKNGLEFWFDKNAFIERWPYPLRVVDYDKVKDDVAAALCKEICLPNFKAKAPYGVNKSRVIGKRLRIAFAKSFLSTT